MINKKIQATVVLIIMIIGFCLTYNSTALWLKIINVGFLAGTIGGLADWFAITALFRKPLGFISLGTEILPKNRERIIDEIVKFIGEDLLNANYLITQLNKISLHEVIMSYGQANKVQKELRCLCNIVGESVEEKLPTLLPHLLTMGNSGKVTAEQSRAWSRAVYNYIMSKEQDPLLNALWVFIIKLVQILLGKSFIHQFLDYHIEALKDKYVGNHFARSVAAGFIDLSGKDLAKKFNNHLENLKLELKEPNNRTALYYKIKLARKLRDYLNNPQAWENIKELLAQRVNKNYNLFQQEIASQQLIAGELYQVVSGAFQNEHQADHLSQWLKKEMVNFAQDKSDAQLSYLRNQLNRYSNEELIALVETKVGDDLQMIRINGSLVGAVAGMVLYAISLGVERVWG